MEEYDNENVKVKDYALWLNGREILPSELEDLPLKLRPSSLAAPRSKEALAFYTKHSFLSNHFRSTFVVEDMEFHSVEQYLAYRRATLSKKKQFIKRASKATNPAEAKYILNCLSNNNSKKWNNMRGDVLLTALRAKFGQHAPLATYLKDTKDLQLGEASTNPVWGIGMTLDNKDILNTSKWNQNGNLLGRSLMKVRAELSGKAPPSSHSSGRVQDIPASSGNRAPNESASNTTSSTTRSATQEKTARRSANNNRKKDDKSAGNNARKTSPHRRNASPQSPSKDPAQGSSNTPQNLDSILAAAKAASNTTSISSNRGKKN